MERNDNVIVAENALYQSILKMGKYNNNITLFIYCREYVEYIVWNSGM